jgi:HK97 family phage major capsid protein
MERTMTRLEKYKKQHGETVVAMKAILEAAEETGGTLTADQDKEYKALDVKRRDLEASIDRETAVEAAERKATAVVTQPAVESVALTVVRGGEDREVQKPWLSFGEQMKAIQAAYSPGGEFDRRLYAGAPSCMNQMVPSEGGFAVAPQFSTEIWDKLNASTDNLIGETDQYVVEGESLSFNANAETARTNGSRYGGVQGYWINEADQITKSKPKLRQLKLEPTELAVLIYCTDKALQNAPALEQFLTRAATDELGFLVGDAVVNGLGGFQPKGLMGSGSKVVVNKETSQATGTFLKANANKMWARMHPRLRSGAVWLMNVDVEPALDDFFTSIKNVAGSENVGGLASMIYNADRNTLKGRPIRFVEYCQSLTTEGDVILTNLQTYATGVRGAGVKYATSIHVRFEYAETAFRFMLAVDGQSWLNAPITPYKGTNTLSNIVTLQTR